MKENPGKHTLSEIPGSNTRLSVGWMVGLDDLRGLLQPVIL